MLGVALTFRLFITSQGEGLSGRAKLQGLLEVLGEQEAISVPWSQEHPIGRAEEGDPICQGQGSINEHSHFAAWPHAADDTRVPGQSCSQVNVRPPTAGQTAEPDGGPVPPECAVDQLRGQGLWGLQGGQLQVWHLQGVSLIGPDERSSAGVPRPQGEALFGVGVHHTLHVFCREASELWALQEGVQGHEAVWVCVVFRGWACAGGSAQARGLAFVPVPAPMGSPSFRAPWRRA